MANANWNFNRFISIPIELNACNIAQCMAYIGSKSLEHTNTHTHTHIRMRNGVHSTDILWCIIEPKTVALAFYVDSFLKPVNCQLFHWSPNHFDLCRPIVVAAIVQLAFGSCVWLRPAVQCLTWNTPYNYSYWIFKIQYYSSAIDAFCRRFGFVSTIDFRWLRRSVTPLFLG